jgi:predicted aspartyl protease
MNPGACTLVGDGVPEILIGRQWLKSRRLVVDMSAGILKLEASKKQDEFKKF